MLGVIVASSSFQSGEEQHLRRAFDPTHVVRTGPLEGGQRLGRPAGSACSADAAQRGRLVAEEISLCRTDDALQMQAPSYIELVGFTSPHGGRELGEHGLVRFWSDRSEAFDRSCSPGPIDLDVRAGGIDIDRATDRGITEPATLVLELQADPSLHVPMRTHIDHPPERCIKHVDAMHP
jgi:hypothetical protein